MYPQVKQIDQLPGEDQTANTAGGYVYVVDDVTKLKRFLLLGTDRVLAYHTSNPVLLRQNVACIDK